MIKLFLREGEGVGGGRERQRREHGRGREQLGLWGLVWRRGRWAGWDPQGLPGCGSEDYGLKDFNRQMTSQSCTLRSLPPCVETALEAWSGSRTGVGAAALMGQGDRGGWNGKGYGQRAGWHQRGFPADKRKVLLGPRGWEERKRARQGQRPGPGPVTSSQAGQS